MSTPEERFAHAVRILRKKAGYTQADMASQIGVQQAMLSRWENSKRRIHLNEAVTICKILGVQLADVLDSSCQTCFGSPPAGFHCNACGASS